MKTYKALILSLGVLVVPSFHASAANQGSVGATSTGDTTITCTVPEYIQVTGLADFALGSWNGSAGFDANDNIIISGNDDTSPTYDVTLSGDGASSAFTIARTAGTAHALPYTVCFNDATGTSGCTSATATTPITGQTNPNQAISSTTENANIRIQIANSDLRDAPAGSYSGVLTIVVDPD